MSENDAAPDRNAPEPEPAWQRRRRLARIFGDVLPEQTSDDRAGVAPTADQWLREQVPPHHGD